MSWIFSIRKEFALTKIEESDIKDDSGKEPITEDDADPEDLEVFYPTHQWQTIRPGNMLMTNYSIPLKPHLTALTEALQKLKIPVCSHDDVFFCWCSDKEVWTQWPNTGTRDHHRTGWQWEQLLKCFQFTGAGRVGCHSHCRWWCVSLTSSEALSLFVRLSRDRFYNVCWHAVSQVCCAPVWAGEMLVSGNLIKNHQCNTTQLFNNGFSVPWVFEIQLLSLSIHATKKPASLFLGWYLLLDMYGTRMVRRHQLSRLASLQNPMCWEWLWRG